MPCPPKFQNPTAATESIRKIPAVRFARSYAETGEHRPVDPLNHDGFLATTFVRPGLPLIGWMAAALVGGIVLGSAVPSAPLLFLGTGPACLFAANVSRRQRRHRGCFVCVLAAIVLLGAARWQLHQAPSARESLKDICGDGPVPLTLTGHITSVPCLHSRPSSKNAPRIFGTARQSRFLVSTQSVMTSSGERNAGGNLQVYVEGDATATLHKGDEVMLTGRWNWPFAPGNPG